MTGGVVEDRDREYLAEVGLNVRVGRMRRRMNQDQLAAAANLSRVTLGSIERGKHAANLLTYRKLAQARGLPLADLLTKDTT